MTWTYPTSGKIKPGDQIKVRFGTSGSWEQAKATVGFEILKSWGKVVRRPKHAPSPRQ